MAVPRQSNAEIPHSPFSSGPFRDGAHGIRSVRSDKYKNVTKRGWVVKLVWIKVAAALAALLLFYSYRRLLQSLVPYDGSDAVEAGRPISRATFTSMDHKRDIQSPKNDLRITAINERTRGLLEILLSAKKLQQQNNGSARPPWPSYLTLYSQADDPLRVNDSHRGDSRITSCIVTAYFRVPNKYSSDKYEDDWIEKMLGSISDCMVIFCEDSMAEKMREFRKDNDHNNPTAIVTLRLEDLPVAHYYHNNSDDATQGKENAAEAFWENQLVLDPEQKRHRSYQLFWIWLSKSWFVTTATILQQHLFPPPTIDTPTSEIQYWMWADIGSFRQKSKTRTQLIRHPEALRDSQGDADDFVVWMAHRDPNPPKDPLWNHKLQEKEHFYHSGSHGFGTGTAWINFHAAFVETLEQYSGKFVGEDQCVLQSTCLLHPRLCAYVPHDQVPDNRYFGLRHVLRYGPANDERVKPFQLWRPPNLTAAHK